MNVAAVKETTMNKKLTFKAPNGNICYCVLNGEPDLSQQIEKIFNIMGGGYTAKFENEKIHIMDVYHWDTVTIYKVISVEDCDMEVCEDWVKIEPWE